MKKQNEGVTASNLKRLDDSVASYLSNLKSQNLELRHQRRLILGKSDKDPTISLNNTVIEKDQQVRVERPKTQSVGKRVASVLEQTLNRESPLPQFQREATSKMEAAKSEEKSRNFLQKHSTAQQVDDYGITFNNQRIVPKEYVDQAKDRMKALADFKLRITTFRLKRMQKSQRKDQSSLLLPIHSSPLQTKPFFGRNFTINRSYLTRDTFPVVFPSYGITPDRFDSTMNKTFFTYSKFDPIEDRPTVQVDREYHRKQNELNQFNEALARTKGMRRGKLQLLNAKLV
ncbi:hypothetical protein FGO68_gene13995 [Halteria grandinella]|uniref:Uncharacterized protein n=1 Tax=Halteria grandinella TaxID=5974 RepID=A0A8J8SVI0_HALGN|nr:hypothetical protein FGO68_gene13995 [Halteria grandinella]